MSLVVYKNFEMRLHMEMYKRIVVYISKIAK